MTRPVATKTLYLAAAVDPRATRRSPLSAIMLLFLVAAIVFEAQLDWGGMIRDAVEPPSTSQSTDFTALAPARIDRRSDYSEYLRAPIFLASREPISLPDMGQTAAVARLRHLGLGREFPPLVMDADARAVGQLAGLGIGGGNPEPGFRIVPGQGGQGAAMIGKGGKMTQGAPVP